VAVSLEAAAVVGHRVERLGAKDDNGCPVRGHWLERLGVEDEHGSVRVRRDSVVATEQGETNARV
jgi:hypothetical protein